MKYFILLSLFLNIPTTSPVSEKVSSVEFVEVLNGNHEEAEYYYSQNWMKLRERAMEKGFITDYHLIKTPATAEFPVHIMLITVYKNMSQYEKAEENFGGLIETMGGLKLLNDKRPDDFRKFVYSEGPVKHIEK